METTGPQDNMSDAQRAWLSRHGVSSPDGLAPFDKLEFANLADAPAPTDPLAEHRLRLDPKLLAARQLDPVQRMRLQERVDQLTQGRFERSVGDFEPALSDDEYLDLAQSLRPHLDQSSAEHVDRILRGRRIR